MKKTIILLLALIFVLSGCSTLGQDPSTNESIDLQFALKGNAGLDKEQRTIVYKNAEEKYSRTMEEWLKGPQDLEKFEQSLNSGVKLLGVTTEQNKLTVNLSKEFNQFNGVMHEGAVVASLVNTMVQFPEIESVRITVEGQDLVAGSGNPYGYMTEIDFNPEGTGNMVSREVILYFADDQAMNVIAEKRVVNIQENASKDMLIRVLLEELIKGPQNTDLVPTIPTEAKVNITSVAGERATVDFSEEMFTKHSRGAAGEDMTLSSIANTLTEIEGIKEIVLTVNGQPLNIEHVIVDSNNPLTRMEDRILKQ